MKFDRTLFHFVNQFAGHHPLLDMVMKLIANDALEIYAVLFLVAWFVLPKSEEKQRHALIISFCSGVLALLINAAIAHVWFRPRPFANLPKGSYTQLIPHGPDASFPSDHTSGGFAFAGGAWGRSARWVSWSFTILAVLTMIARVYCGLHWPTDVLAGVVVGILSGAIVKRLERGLRPVTAIGLCLFRYGPYNKRIAGSGKKPLRP